MSRVTFLSTLLFLSLSLWTSKAGAAQSRSLKTSTRTGGSMPCSLLVNGAVAEKSTGVLMETSDAIEDTSKVLTSFALGGALKGDVTHYPLAAIIGGSQLVTGVEDDSVMISAAVVVGSEICFVSAANNQTTNVFEAECQPVCTKYEERSVSITYHNTTVGTLPFIFIGERQQAWADCDEIIYPERRTALGWMCKNNSEKSLSVRLAFSLISLLVPLALLLLQM